MGTPVSGNDEVERNLVLVEKVAYANGLPPEVISVMLEFAMSLRMGKKVALTAKMLILVIKRNVVDKCGSSFKVK